MKINSFRITLGLLIATFLAVFITNFPFNSYLTGWDNLHPEFNFGLNISRALSSVWQNNQGVGTYGGHGYAATLIHSIILFIASFVVPNMYLRSGFTFACLLIGALGVFFLTRKLLTKYAGYAADFGGLFAGIYYMLNFGTVENFYIQLEAFIVHYALLPWLFLTLIWFLEEKTLKKFIIFSVVSLFATIQGFIPPLFFVYMLLLSVFLFAYILGGNYIERIKTSILIGAVTIVVNAYWLFPVAYYSLTRTGTYLNAYNNLSSTGDFILKNQKYGDLADLMILKGFISEAIDSTTGGNVFYIFSQWLNHLSKPEVIAAGYFIFLFIVVGIAAIIKSKNIPYRLAFLLSFFLVFALLATNTFPLSYVSKIMQDVPVLRQAFRVAFTKFSLSVGFYYALFFGVGIGIILSFIKRFTAWAKYVFCAMFLTVIAVSLIYFSLPVFTGNFIYSRAKIQIPSIYKDLFSFFDKQPATNRIANLPQGWNWGWTVYNWGYSGSGFLWYGIKQPLMDRAFDVWGQNNENYYWEVSHAIYSQDYAALDDVFKKYSVDWVIVDKNVVPYLNAKGALYTDSLDNYLSHSPNYTLVKTLVPQEKNLQSIKIYKVNYSHQKDFEALYLTPIKNIGPSYSYSEVDQGFKDYGTYYTSTNYPYDAYYPFRSLFSNVIETGGKVNDLPITVSSDGKYINLTSTLPKNVEGYGAILPPSSPQYQNVAPTALEKGKNSITVKVQKNTDPNYSYSTATDPSFKNHKANNCSQNNLGEKGSFSQSMISGSILRFTSVNSQNCYSIILPQLFQRYGYIIEVDSRFITGKALQFAVINNDSKKTEIEYALPDSKSFTKTYIIIPPMQYYGAGYSLMLNNIAIGNTTSINDLKSVNLNPIPYELLTGIRLVKNPQGGTRNVFEYMQAYDPGWNAYTINSKSIIQNIFPSIFGAKLENHVLVDNWANGWIINRKIQNQNSKIILVFWPQYLEYLGFLLLGGYGTVLTVIIVKKRIKKSN